MGHPVGFLIIDIVVELFCLIKETIDTIIRVKECSVNIIFVVSWKNKHWSYVTKASSLSASHSVDHDNVTGDWVIWVAVCLLSYIKNWIWKWKGCFPATSSVSWQWSPLLKSPVPGWSARPLNRLDLPRRILHSLAFSSVFWGKLFKCVQPDLHDGGLFLQLSKSLGATQAYWSQRLWFVGCSCAAWWTCVLVRSGESLWAPTATSGHLQNLEGHCKTEYLLIFKNSSFNNIKNTPVVLSC